MLTDYILLHFSTSIYRVPCRVSDGGFQEIRICMRINNAGTFIQCIFGCAQRERVIATCVHSTNNNSK